MLVEAGRLAVTRLGVEPIVVHCDLLNGRGHGMEHCPLFSKNVKFGDIWYRLAVIGYPRQSAVNYRSRRDLYGPISDAIAATYDDLPAERRVVDHKLLHPESDMLSIIDPLVRKEHLEKGGVYYYPLSQIVDRVLCHYGIESDRDRRQPCMLADALHQACLFTNNSYYFFDFCKSLLMTDPMVPDDPWRIALDAAEYYRNRRALVKEGKQRSLPGQRHQPHFNPPAAPKPLEAHKIRDSVHHLGVARALAFQMYDDGNIGKAHSMVCDYLDKKVMGAGKLTCQHSIGVMATGDWMPRSMLDYASIAQGTNTHARLLREFPALAEGKWSMHSDRILKSISHRLGITLTQAENLTCIWGRRSTKTTSGASRRRMTAIQEL